MPSKAITCSREFSDGTQCGRPIVPVFGAWPEECTSCAMRVLVTKDGYEAVAVIIDTMYSRLRSLVIAANERNNPWQCKDMRPRFALLDKLVVDLGARKILRAMSIAQRLDKKDAPKGRLVREPRRTALGYRWESVTPERAIQLRQGGFETRYIGVAWQVKMS